MRIKAGLYKNTEDSTYNLFVSASNFISAPNHEWMQCTIWDITLLNNFYIWMLGTTFNEKMCEAHKLTQPYKPLKLGGKSKAVGQYMSRARWTCSAPKVFTRPQDYLAHPYSPTTSPYVALYTRMIADGIRPIQTMSWGYGTIKSCQCIITTLNQNNVITHLACFVV